MKEKITAYLWLLPALVLLTAFLVKPALETTALSFQESVRFSDKRAEAELAGLLGAGKAVPDSFAKLKSFPDWKKAIVTTDKPIVLFEGI